MKQTKKSLAMLLVFVLALVFIAAAMVPAQSGKDKYKFDKDGNLIRPEGYRLWVYIGTPISTFIPPFLLTVYQSAFCKPT